MVRFWPLSVQVPFECRLSDFCKPKCPLSALQKAWNITRNGLLNILTEFFKILFQNTYPT